MNVAIILAGGKGNRMGLALPKQYYEVNGKAVISYCLRTFLTHEEIDAVQNMIRYDEILFNMPMGERILVNDRKPSGLDMAVAFNVDRDQFDVPKIKSEL